MRPVICMITDGRLTPSGRQAALVERVSAAARAGVDLIQIRETAIDDRVLAAAVSQCVTAVRGTRARVVVNDRLDLAVACGAHGVHLKSESYPAARARAIAPTGFLIGRSVHSAGDAMRADGADYVIFGAVFPTASKPGQAPAGLEALEETVRTTPLPVLAVGGVTIETAGRVVRTGAAGVAAIGLFVDCATATLPSVLQSLTRAFDASASAAATADTPRLGRRSC
jgi:thiamine-phosphate pyrophosphorylase